MVDKDNGPMQSAALIDRLKNLQRLGQDVDIVLSTPHRQGVINIRTGAVLSAQAGVLHGNGALLTLAMLQNATIRTIPAGTTVQKTISLTLEQAERFSSSHKPSPLPREYRNEEQLLEEAQDLFFRFHYKEAVDKLVVILRHNRFYYPAWLWQSRMLTRQDYIARALDEASRWGNNDQDVWREARKMRPQLTSSTLPVKRCIFCWSILTQGSSCSHCRARYTIAEGPPPADLKDQEIRFALSRFNNALQGDHKNSRVAFSLALGHFNLGDLPTSIGHLETAAKLSPQTQLYTGSLALLRSIARTEPPRTVSGSAAPAASPAGDINRPLILMIEDSMTSRKVLSMLLQRHGYSLLEAASGEQAMEAARMHRPQLVLLDVMLPDTNGHELLAKLRNFDHLQDVPFVMLTGSQDTKDRLKGIQGGAQEYLTKPINPQRLISILESYLQASPPPAEKAAAPAKSDRPVMPPPVNAPAGPPSSVAAAAGLALNTPKIPAAAVQSGGQTANGSKTIFVIEDSRTSRKVLSMLLSRNGYSLHEAASGQEALALAPTIRPDLVLLDVTLPDMTGYSILPQLKQLSHFAQVPVIMLTGNRKATDRLQGMLAGSNEYITKPFDPQKLLSVIKGYL